MPDRIRLDGKVAVVTGAAGAIGTATIRLLAERGARIVAVDRREQDLKTATGDLPASAQVLPIAADVTSEDAVADYIRAAIEKFGTIDVFHNNAGVEGDVKPITQYPLEAFRRVIDVNIVGVFLGLKHVLPVMLKQNKGSIINAMSRAPPTPSTARGPLDKGTSFQVCASHIPERQGSNIRRFFPSCP
jgi:NADP-dependent 3-hydroxy acid dehydrogenase YdfG